MTSEELLKRLGELHPSLIDLSLTRVLRLLEALGNPHLRLPKVIHIAGTNGKGSTLAMLRSILEHGGYKVHCFVSPHLVRFNERIQLTGPEGCQPIDEEALCDVLERAEKANEKKDITFFEITTVAAFLAFSEHPADVLILETGLGGRLDATNVIPSPLASVITPIAMDHMSFLGDTLEQIAGEKAGIIKPQVPLILSHQSSSVLGVIEEIAGQNKSPLYAAGREWDCYEHQGRLVFQTENSVIDLPPPSLFGKHQYINAGSAIATIYFLKDIIPVSHQAMADGLENTYWPARFERLSNNGLLTDFLHIDSEIWLDGGHNPAGARALAQALGDLEERASKPLHLIVGMLERKDATGFLENFKGQTQKVICINVPGAKNSYSAEELTKLAQEVGLDALPAKSIQDALKKSFQLSAKPTRLLICGSLYLAGEVLKLHNEAKYD